MTTARAKVFWTGRSQAVRLPKEFRVDADAMLIRRDGRSIVLEPLDSWPEGYVESFAGASAGLRRPAQRKQEKREPLA